MRFHEVTGGPHHLATRRPDRHDQGPTCARWSGWWLAGHLWLFDGTIADNIAYWRDPPHREEQVARAVPPGVRDRSARHR
ncbi:hypothetical protein [Nonomuraea dietziae]|uniref:hypothetical protein n=1 Tax=Nonomuraea dietziae TaxID=65515 RepID=UPI0031E3BF4E